MRFQTFVSAGLAALALGACSASEPPVKLAGALYHGFTLVDAGAGALTHDAWMVVGEGEIKGQGAGSPPSGLYVAIVDLSGLYALPRGGADIAFVDENPLVSMTDEGKAALIMTDGVLHDAASKDALLNEGLSLSSPHPSSMETFQ